MSLRELFEQQYLAYHDPCRRPGAMIGMHTFDSSASINDPLKKFGSTPKKVLLAAAKEQIAKTRRQTA